MTRTLPPSSIVRWVAFLLLVPSLSVADEQKAQQRAQFEAVLKWGTRLGWSAETIKIVSSRIETGTISEADSSLSKLSLLLVNINPEGRVKVNRGPSEAILEQGKPRLFLMRIENLSGGQPRLTPTTRYVADSDNPFSISLARVDLLGANLLGLPVEYRLVEVSCRQEGRREITIVMEAGQGTQDLGFRAEVPVLFDVSKSSGSDRK